MTVYPADHLLMLSHNCSKFLENTWNVSEWIFDLLYRTTAVLLRWVHHLLALFLITAAIYFFGWDVLLWLDFDSTSRIDTSTRSLIFLFIFNCIRFSKTHMSHQFLFLGLLLLNCLLMDLKWLLKLIHYVIASKFNHIVRGLTRYFVCLSRHPLLIQ